MKVGSLFAGVMGVLAMGLALGAEKGTDAKREGRDDAEIASSIRQRLARSVANIQAVYEATQKSGRIQRRQLWLVNEALPWRSTLQPSCRRQHDYDPKQTPESWPLASDAPALRTLLTDHVPGIRALAAEALATLHQPEDIPRLAELVTDPADATMELVARFMAQQAGPGDFAGPGPDAITGHTWRKSSVADHAAWGVHLMLGDCCPPVIGPGLRSGLVPLAAGDPKDHLWYWQEYIHRNLHQVAETAEIVLRANTPGFDQLDWSRRNELVVPEQRRAEKEWIKSFITEMRAWPAERRAMVRLLASNVHQGGADMAYYNSPDMLLFSGPLELGLPKGRVLELLDGIRLWPDERRDHGGRSQVVERLAMGWRECFDAEDVPRLLAHFSNSKGGLWWSARAALMLALANLMPSTGTATEDPTTAEGFLRRTLKEDRRVFIRDYAASELLRRGPDIHWPLLRERFFADRDNGDYLPQHILRWFIKAPAGAGPTRQLIDLVSDDRFRPLWLEPVVQRGKGSMGGRCRYGAVEALNARAGRAVVTDEDLQALSDPKQGPTRLQIILARVREIGKP